MDLQLDDRKVRALLSLAHEYDMPGLMGALTAYLLPKSCQVQPAAPGSPVPPLAEMWITANTAKVPLTTSCTAPAIPSSLCMLKRPCSTRTSASFRAFSERRLALNAAGQSTRVNALTISILC